MIRTGIVSLSLAILLLASAAYAQEDQPGGQETTQTQTNSSGTAPEGTGSTGWTGGTGGSRIGTSNSTTTGSATTDAPKEGQPFVATGEDLNGPPQQFPPNKTPE